MAFKLHMMNKLMDGEDLTKLLFSQILEKDIRKLMDEPGNKIHTNYIEKLASLDDDQIKLVLRFQKLYAELFYSVRKHWEKLTESEKVIYSRNVSLDYLGDFYCHECSQKLTQKNEGHEDACGQR